MATFVVLFNWTDQGVKSFKDSPSRVDAAKQASVARAHARLPSSAHRNSPGLRFAALLRS